MELPLVSTVIPTFNRRALIERAVDSALAQSYGRQEIIVVDDGSTDGTAELLERRYGDLVRCVTRPNGGVSKARNTGMALARGELIALLDSDDEWDPTKLEKQVDFLRSRPDFGMVLTDVRRVDRQRRTIDVFHRRDVIRTDGDVLLDVLRNPALVPASAMFRRDVFEQLGGFDESLATAEDLDFHLRAAAAFKIGVIEECLTIAMRGHEGLSNAATSDSDYTRVVEEFLAEHGARVPAADRRKALFATYVRNAGSAFRSGRVVEARSYLARAVRYARSPRDATEVFRVAMLVCRLVAVKAMRSRSMRASAE
jgi:glycosyltransferase involved in cell wall biosynthesis